MGNHLGAINLDEALRGRHSEGQNDMDKESKWQSFERQENQKAKIKQRNSRERNTLAKIQSVKFQKSKVLTSRKIKRQN